MQALLARRLGVGFGPYPAVGPRQCWLAPYQLVSASSTLTLVGFDGLRSSSLDTRALIPVNLANEHWILLDADFANGRLTILDSARHTADIYYVLL